jgi:branched-chain amino acid transport system permease protein
MVRDVGVTPEVGILAGTVAAGLLGWLFGVLAIKRTGIYFAMITLALAQMVYFIVLQVKATGGEDGLQGVPRGHLFGLVDLSDNIAMYYLVYAVFSIRLLHHLPDHPFTFWPDSQSHPRERTARYRWATT